jgi:hypothetical protein
MRHEPWMVVLAMLFMAAGLAAQEPATRSDEAWTVEQMELRERELELKEQEAEMMYRQKLREMELEQRHLEIERLRNEGKKPGGDGGGGILLLWILVVHILLTVWVWKDMREQEIGRALWVPIVLLTGMLGALLYAVVRVADTRAKPTQAAPRRAR